VPRVKQHVKQVSAFLTVGVLSAAIDGGVFLLLERVGVHAVAASVIGFLTSFIFNYFGNRRLVFRANHPGTFWKYVTLVGVNLGLSAGIVALGVAWGILPIVAKVASMVIIAALNFVMLRSWVFRHPAPSQPAEPEPVTESGT